MNKKEVINDLIVQGNVEPCITELGIAIWLNLIYAYVYLVAPNCVLYFIILYRVISYNVDFWLWIFERTKNLPQYV